MQGITWWRDRLEVVPEMHAHSFLAKAVEFNADGTFNVLGAGFVHAPNFPAPLTMDSLFLVVRLELTPEEAKQKHALLVHVLGPDGNVIGETREVPFLTTEPSAPPAPDHTLTVAFNFQGITLPVYGCYRFQTVVDGANVGRTVFQLEGPAQAVSP